LIFSTTYTIVSLHWISLVTLPGYLGLLLLFALYFTILFLCVRTIWKISAALRYLSFLCLWIAFEYLQNLGEFRFAWFNLGYSLADYLVLVQPAEIGGIYLLSILIILTNILIFHLRHRKRILIISVAGLLILWSGYGFWRMKKIDLYPTGVTLSLVQVSIPQEKKWEATYLDTTLALYEQYTREADLQNPAMIIWPESALPVYLKRSYSYRMFVHELARELDTEIFTGFPDYEAAYPPYPSPYKFYNSAGIFFPDGTISEAYRKIILVPFGERMPFLDLFPMLWKVQLGQANFEFGEKPVYYDLNGFTFSPLICFEIAFTGLTTRMARDNTDFLVNITNDAWFKRSVGTYQHSVMTRIRAIEIRQQIFRCANTGYSLIVSPRGDYLARTQLYEKTVINSELFLYDKKTTYVRYFYILPVILTIVASAIVIICLLKDMWNRR
ncbi:MAG: apolipoprotein N-acyltransferase, partial [Candidatus Cloacimonetes bacterium]|nr:apolipoprotein N-acyltransferase [Candidatus Cloacimonadota bacterium]